MYAGVLPSLRELDHLQHLSEGLHPRDLICLLPARECDRLLRQGPRRDHLRREETLPAMRGRLLAHHQILRRHGRLAVHVSRSPSLPDEILSDLFSRLGS